MPVASLTSSQGASGALWLQIQQQQAQRNADQAEQRAQALQGQARAAQSEADRAQENARSLQVESNSARSDAGNARRNLSAMKSLEGVQTKLSDVRQQIGKILQPPVAAAEPAPLAPVVNAFGQETGTLVNVTA